MKVLGVIPARYGSQRFPGKVIAPLGKKPMVQWVYEAASRCKDLDHLVIATDDERVRDAVKAFGGEVLMTSEDHKAGSDRLAEVSESYKDYQIVVNIQGDEPGIEPDLISGVVQLLKDHPEWEVTTAARPFEDAEDPLIPNRVKVTLTKKGKVLYFSRSLIPFPRNKTGHPVFLHLGIYAYRRDFLLRFRTLPGSGLEDTESLEQLRVLENDYSMGAHIVKGSLPGVDTPEDLQNITAIFRKKGMLE
ncbi:MAG TPA: 3-deoxy-manno-octulosonate cytidylyltransferase [Leptospiraceae bacterium]|jgi:3-deoxy-manno-octulosonate cytidylyltransferase (CMP-KDO synthetase)|nr:3-deoxy-manno-octulosonate cytidylyltransferase [Leptospirales bacterium]HMU81793.1 3-deoxy-manno-octulosonate cytidylyltransferase [Leptospiraceae bacterium]HMW58735.1 3-deoxy-manno-octulosonate cytidylyltransferase [Leptospiraceae bacterium]HMX55368.1 3-deoxy-manno-octulosonate cytidylyltransferase [Leptospiraceae bacterium]HNE21730.1 3-deoxy-manno-octulosonate cytidylyltransferase [Leptospiraceae bacterium]